MWGGAHVCVGGGAYPPRPPRQGCDATPGMAVTTGTYQCPAAAPTFGLQISSGSLLSTQACPPPPWHASILPQPSAHAWPSLSDALPSAPAPASRPVGPSSSALPGFFVIAPPAPEKALIPLPVCFFAYNCLSFLVLARVNVITHAVANGFRCLHAPCAALRCQHGMPPRLRAPIPPLYSPPCTLAPVFRAPSLACALPQASSHNRIQLCCVCPGRPYLPYPARPIAPPLLPPAIRPPLRSPGNMGLPPHATPPCTAPLPLNLTQTLSTFSKSQTPSPEFDPRIDAQKLF